jgi:AcrR family transcriptional regulator
VQIPHPTAQLLIETVVNLLDQKSVDYITSEEVLQLSGISRGSMYHHFHDFEDLVDTALVKRFSRYIAETNAGFIALSLKDLRAALKRMTHTVHVPERAQYRFERIRIFGRASEHPNLRAKLAIEQDSLTDTMELHVAQWQERGFLVKDFTARSIAVAIQAIVIGRVVDEIADKHVDREDWLALMDRIIDTFFVED